MTTTDIFQDLRPQFPALQRRVANRPAVFFDGPAGTQVPRPVIEAMADYLSRCNANRGGPFATSQESDRELEQSHEAVADLLGADDPHTIAFGQNMTSLTFALSRALARDWKEGDEVLVTRLDHDANIRPWMLAAEERGVRVRIAEIQREDGTLDLEDLRSKLNERTRLVAVGCASNSTGSLNPVATICQWARQVGALSFLDAVHHAPHAPLDVQAFGCDFLVCSAYKFFGPHIGIQWGRRELLEQIQPYKLRPAPDTLPGKWMTGTQSHEGIVGVRAAIEYLAEIGRRFAPSAASRREALLTAMNEIRRYEQQLALNLLERLAGLASIRIWGISDPSRIAERLPTISLTHAHLSPQQLATTLARQGIFVWNGHYYAIELSEALGNHPQGMVRVGLVHYNTLEETEQLVAALERLDGGSTER